MKKKLLLSLGGILLIAAVAAVMFVSPGLYQGSLGRITDIVSTPIRAGQIKNLISNDCNGKCQALVFVEEDILAGIQSNLDVWEQDIKREFKADVHVFPVHITDIPAPEEIKDIIWEYENIKNKDVFVVLFVGNIPYMRAYISTDADKNIMAQSYFPSDLLFADGENHCAFHENLYAYNAGGSFGCLIGAIDELPFVTGRLSPYGTNTERINLINAYFQRNHAHRTSKNQYGIGNGKLLVNITLPSESEFMSEIRENLSWLNSPEIIDPNLNENDDNYLNELQKNYSAVYFNGHGGPRFHEYNINPDILRGNRPAGLYYSLKSCSVGDISVEDNLASSYLFSGDALFAYSNSIPVFSGTHINSDVYYIMKGTPIYKYYSKFTIGNYLATTILMGDPTLSVRKNNSERIPDVRISPYSLDFGQISLSSFEGDWMLKEYPYGVKNNSSEPIYIDESTISMRFTQGAYNALGALDFSARLNSNYSLSAENEPFSTNYGVKIQGRSSASGRILFTVEKALVERVSDPYRKFRGKIIFPMYAKESDQMYILDIPFKGEIVP